ncbi:MAG: MraZ N-terminal domain-containing protein, partial [Bryobacteraceae bacterium]
MENEEKTVAVRRPRGMFSSRVDEKGRLKLPVDVQRYLEATKSSQVYITSFEGQIARIYSIEEWERAEALLESSSEDAVDGEDLYYKAQ